MQVFTRLSRAALCARWSPCGRKFALGSGEKRICVCYHERQNAWWAAKLLRRCHDSSVGAVAWHPGGRLLASTSSDGRCRVFNAAIAGPRLVVQACMLPCSLCDHCELKSKLLAGVDDDSAAAPGSFGDMLMDIEAGQGWGIAVAWSPTGAFSGLLCMS